MKSILVTNDSPTARKLTGRVRGKGDHVIEETEGGMDGTEWLSAFEAGVNMFPHEATRPEVLICERESLLGGGHK
jgi:hypothetical protein